MVIYYSYFVNLVGYVGKLRALKSIVVNENDEGVGTNQIKSLGVIYALSERALMSDWCLCSGEYSLAAYSAPLMRAFLSQYKKER